MIPNLYPQLHSYTAIYSDLGHSLCLSIGLFVFTCFSANCMNNILCYPAAKQLSYTEKLSFSPSLHPSFILSIFSLYHNRFRDLGELLYRIDFISNLKPQIRESKTSKSGDVMIPQENPVVLQPTMEQDVSSTVLIYIMFYSN